MQCFSAHLRAFFCSRLVIFLAIVAFALIAGVPVKLHAQPYFEVRVNKQWGVIDSTGKIIIKPAYDRMNIYGNNNNFIVAYLGDSAFLINSRLQIVARTNYRAIIENGEGMFETQLRRDLMLPWIYGLMDSTGRIIVEPKFTTMEPFTDGVCQVEIYTDTTNGKSVESAGIIDKKGDWIVHPVYESRELKPSREGLINFYASGKGWGAMDVSGKIVIQPKYKWLGACTNGYMEYKMSNNGSGLMRRDETVVIPDDDRYMIDYGPESAIDTLVTVHSLRKSLRSLFGYDFADGKIYTVSGKYLFDVPRYGNECSEERNGFFQVSNKQLKRGMMNAVGKIVADPQYRVLQWFQAGLKQVEKNEKWGFINDDGKEVIPCIYDDTRPFDNGLAAVYFGGGWLDYFDADKHPNMKMGYINREGKVIWQPSW